MFKSRIYNSWTNLVKTIFRFLVILLVGHSMHVLLLIISYYRNSNASVFQSSEGTSGWHTYKTRLPAGAYSRFAPILGAQPLETTEVEQVYCDQVLQVIYQVVGVQRLIPCMQIKISIAHIQYHFWYTFYKPFPIFFCLFLNKFFVYCCCFPLAIGQKLHQPRNKCGCDFAQQCFKSSRFV